MGSNRMKAEEEEDRISALPDAIIHHILSFLPSTKEAIQTSLLSKRWLKQWTHVPILIFIFDFSGMRSDYSSENIYRVSRFIDNTLTLHDCSKIKKFYVRSNWYSFAHDPTFDVKLQFAMKKDVEELILNFECERNFKLPNFFFNYASLVKLRLSHCMMPNGKVNWGSLKDLDVSCCSWSNEAIVSVVSGSPLLESLEIYGCEGFDRLAIASKSLKRLNLIYIQGKFVLEISCPELEEFYISSCEITAVSLYNGAIESVVSGSLLMLGVVFCKGLKQLVVGSKSLKKLILEGMETDAIVISCPSLKELHLRLLGVDTIELMNPRSLLRATLDFECSEVRYGENLVKICEKLHHVEKLTMGAYFIKVLSSLELRGVSSPVINRKCLAFNCASNFVEHLPGIAYALRSSPGLEKLVINLLSSFECDSPEVFVDLNDSAEKYWNSKETVFSCLVSHLKIVKLVGLSDNYDDNYDALELTLNFVEFLLKNARVLEKMVITFESSGADFVLKVSEKLLNFPRFSQHTVVELRKSW